MPFDDDNRDVPKPAPDPLDAARPLAREVHTVLIAPDVIERAAMADFCQSLSPEDWLALEALGQRVRNAMLKQTVRIALRWRKRRAR